MGWNPANWEITDTLQGQSGGINPLKAVVKYTIPTIALGDMAKDSFENWAAQPSKAVITNTTGQTGTQGYTDPNQTTNNTTTTTTANNTPTIDWSSIAEANDLIAQAQDQLNRLPNQADIFNSNLTNQFAQYRNQLQEGFNRNQGDYQDNKLKTMQQQERTNQQIRSGAGNQMNALARYLNSIGAGDTMAARGMLPYGIARQAQKQSGDANQVYGENLSGLDKSWGRYKTDYDNSLLDLTNQENTKRKNFQAEQLNAQMAAQNNLRRGQSALKYAQTGDAAQARAIREAALPEMFRILQQIDNLGRQDVSGTVKDATYTAPDLQNYEYQDGQAVQGADQTGTSDVSPWLQYLLKMRQEDQNLLGY